VSFEGSNLHCDARTGKGGGSEAEIEIAEGERIYCTAHQVGYYFNMDRNKPVRFPKEFLDYYESI
jgi:acyl-CoA thioesterase FadM